MTYSYFTDNTKTAQLIVDENVTLYASYTAYARVCFEPGLGTGDMPSIMASKGEYYTLPANGFTAPEDMYFVGWKDTSTDTVYTAGQTMERYFRADEHEVTFEAQWRSKKVLTITVPDATLDQSALGFPVEFTWNGTESLTSGKWLDGYDAETQTGGSIRQRLPAGSTCFGMITFPRGVSEQTILRALGAGGTMVLKNATLVDVVSSGSGTSVRVTLVVSLQPRTCTVSFMSGGGSGTMAKKTDIYPGSTYKLPNCGFTAPPDMVFGYWSLAWAGSSVHDDVLGLPSITVTVDEDLTLIARWNVSAGAIPVTPDHFPDDDFRQYGASCFDLNKNGWLSPAEIAQADSLCIEEYADMHNVQGIHFLTELTFIMIDGNPNLTELDLSQNTKLTGLEIYDNSLTTLILGQQPALESIYADHNAFTTVDLSGAPNLKYLDIASNPLTEIDLSATPDLKELYIYGTELAELDLSGNPILLDAYLNGTRTENAVLGYVVYSGGPLGGRLLIDPDQEVVTEATPDHVPGDINGDGKVNNKDVTRLQKYLSGEEVDVNPAALDVNGDGKVNNKDLTRLQKYLKGDDVEIH